MLRNRPRSEAMLVENGQIAALVILDRDPTSVDPMEIRDIQVLETIKDGKTVYKA